MRSVSLSAHVRIVDLCTFGGAQVGVGFLWMATWIFTTWRMRTIVLSFAFATPAAPAPLSPPPARGLPLHAASPVRTASSATAAAAAVATASGAEEPSVAVLLSGAGRDLASATAGPGPRAASNSAAQQSQQPAPQSHAVNSVNILDRLVKVTKLGCALIASKLQAAGAVVLPHCPLLFCSRLSDPAVSAGCDPDDRHSVL